MPLILIFGFIVVGIGMSVIGYVIYKSCNTPIGEEQNLI